MIINEGKNRRKDKCDTIVMNQNIESQEVCLKNCAEMDIKRWRFCVDTGDLFRAKTKIMIESGGLFGI